MFEKARSFLLDEDRGVSPVIGVILMVAITVILAAVIATFVMNMGPEQSSPANANWDWSHSGSSGSYTVTLEHSGGEAASAGDYFVDGDASRQSLSDAKFSDDITAGASKQVASGLSDGDTVQLIWEDPESDQTQIVDEYDL